MKRKVYLIIIILLLVFILITIIILKYSKKEEMSDLYKEYRYPNEDCFGKELYSEIDHKPSDYELEVGEIIVNRGIEVIEFAGTEQEAEIELGDVGALSMFYYFDYKDKVSQEGTLQFITCKINGDEGRVWAVYTLKRYDENGKGANVGANILCILYIEKQNDEWVVIKVDETP